MLITLRDSWRGLRDNSERSTGVESLSASAPWWSKGKTRATVCEWTGPWARFSVKCGPAGCWGSLPGPIRQQKHQGSSSNDIWMSGTGKNPRDVIPTIIIALWLKMGHYQRERWNQKDEIFLSPHPPQLWFSSIHIIACYLREWSAQLLTQHCGHFWRGSRKYDPCPKGVTALALCGK